ncbi:MAG: diguanylate cyclase domain-containing protein, partial [Burkholderiaceae bacterium]
MLVRHDASRSSAVDPSQDSSRSAVQPFFDGIAEILGRLHATHSALRAAQFRISRLVEANLVLERHARALAEEVDSARHRTLHDPLTGLANRALLADRLKQAILHARREERHIAVIMLDLDGFKA